MRIIAGEFRHRKLFSPPESAPTRPIPDRVKESLFGILRGHVPGATILDAFAGTGSIGLEALSRGAERVVFVEKHREMARILERNIDTLGVKDRTEIFIGDALGAGALARCPRPLTLAFFDPPYDLVADPLGLTRVKAQIENTVQLLSPDGFVIFRTPWPFNHEIWPEGAGPNAQTEEPRPRRGRRDSSAPDPTDRRKKDERWRWTQGASWVEVGHGKHAGGPTPDDLDEPDPEEEPLEPEETADPEAPKPTRVDADLSIPNTLGPETHRYGTMAVHFYARPRST